MTPSKRWIRADLTAMWRRNVRQILKLLDWKQAELGRAIGVSRQAINIILSDEGGMTGVQFAATMYALDFAIGNDRYSERIRQARMLWDELDNCYAKNGLY